MAQTDPLWAICTELGPGAQGPDSLDRFWESGRADVRAALDHVLACGLTLPVEGEALDFGCGAGRVSHPISDVFAGCLGVDVSPTMIGLARSYSQDSSKLKFVLNHRPDLGGFDSGRFSFVYTTRVLQHLSRSSALRYLSELIRVLEPEHGVLVVHAHESSGGRLFSVLSSGQLLWQRAIRLAIRRRNAVVRIVGRASVPLPAWMQMTPLPLRTIGPVIEGSGGRVVGVREISFNPLRFHRLGFLLGPLADRRNCGWRAMEYVIVKP